MYFGYIIETLIVALRIKCLTRDEIFSRLFKRAIGTHSLDGGNKTTKTLCERCTHIDRTCWERLSRNRRHQSLCVYVYACVSLEFFFSQHTQDIKLLTLILHIIYITLFYRFWAAHWLIRFGFSIKRKTCLYCHFEHSNFHSRQIHTLCYIWSYCDKN